MLLDSKECPWQARMNACYDKWNKHENNVADDLHSGKINQSYAVRLSWDFGDMLRYCCVNEKDVAACVLGKLNQQIENGGIVQWIENGYVKDSLSYLPALMDKLGPVSRKIWAFLRNFLDDFTDDGDICWDEVDEDELLGADDLYSRKFYELLDEWHKEVYAFLNS